MPVSSLAVKGAATDASASAVRERPTSAAWGRAHERRTKKDEKVAKSDGRLPSGLHRQHVRLAWAAPAGLDAP